MTAEAAMKNRMQAVVAAQVMNAVVRHVDWETVKCLVLAGPGFVKDDLKKHMEEEAVRRDLRYACAPMEPIPQ